MHSKTGIEEIRLLAVENIRDALGDARWEFMVTERDPDVASVLATVGNNRFGTPDIILGCGVADRSLGAMRESMTDLIAYLEWHKDFTSGDIDLVDYYSFLLEHRDYKEVAPIRSTDRLHLRHVDADRWMSGMGWQHGAFYNADERENARFLQFVLSDEQGRLPWDEGYSYINQLVLDSEPFGRKPVAKPAPARAHYLN
jgi:hypothetical protein